MTMLVEKPHSSDEVKGLLHEFWIAIAKFGDQMYEITEKEDRLNSPDMYGDCEQSKIIEMIVGCIGFANEDEDMRQLLYITLVNFIKVVVEGYDAKLGVLDQVASNRVNDDHWADVIEEKS